MLEVGIVYNLKWYRMLKSTAEQFELWETFENFSYDGLKGPLDALYEKVSCDSRDKLLDQVMLGVLHPNYKELKFQWGRENYFSENFPLKEVRHIFMARSDMLPLNFKPWFPSANFACTLCDLKADETTEHFLIDCPFYRDLRSQRWRMTSCLDILEGAIGWKELSLYIKALS